MDKLTPKQERFVLEYVRNGGNATAAAKAAGYSERTARVSGLEALAKPAVKEAIGAIINPELRALRMDAERVVQEWTNVAGADARSLVQYRVGSCRYCHGEGHRWHRTPAERERDFAEHQTMVMASWGDVKALKRLGQFDELGGVGYNPNTPPNPDCPECFGDGVGRTIISDTRDLPPEAVSLYAGIKTTKDGVEVKTHDKMAALDRLAKFLKLTGFASDPEGQEPRQVLHLHLVRFLQELPPAEQEALRPVLLRLAGPASSAGS